ncbi:transposase family protein [Nostoc sp.]|uniref:transposase family protein n=1 Tax=Nostoc sp. TaxID=1180 RepID=UPI003FA5405B
MATGFENNKSKTKASFVPSIDSKDITTKFQQYFTKIKDPRMERTRWHSLTDIITIAILAVIAGAQGWEDIECQTIFSPIKTTSIKLAIA